MVFPFLAALPAIFKGIDLFAGLFEDGRKVVEAVTGKPSAAATPEDLRVEVENMTPDQQAAWADAMTAKLEEYKAATDRLRNEQGDVDAATLGALPAEVAGKVAWLRMTTRPWAVRWCLRTLIAPVWVLLGVDAPIALHNIVSAAYGGGRALKFLSETLVGGSSGFYQMYTWFAPAAVSIVIAYMGLREIGKAKGASDEPTISGVVGKVASFVRDIRK